MEKLQAPIIPSFWEDYMKGQCSNLEEKMSFFQILQSVENPLFLPFQETKPESCITHITKSNSIQSEKTKRKRMRPTKNKDELENQRITHIAIERNRRKQMNDHLNVLRSLMPNSYVQRFDQASIIGGAIDYVKELEQLLQSLEAPKRMFRSPAPETSKVEEVTAEIEVTVIQSHVNLKIMGPKKDGKLVKIIIALENLKLSILHLNITSSLNSVHYSFNLKIEDGSKMGLLGNEIARAVDEIFNCH